MSVARAFPILRYNPDVAGDPGVLLAPPYDVIDDEEWHNLADMSRYQSVLIEAPDNSDAIGAAHLFRRWLQEDAIENAGAGIVVVKQRFVGPDGIRRSRVGVLCEARLDEPGRGTVFGHEQVFDGPVRGRLDLLRETEANISPVFLVYNDPERTLTDLVSSVTDDEPDFTAVSADGTQIAVWFVIDPAVCELFESAVAPHPMLIADGHHRYCAALAHCEEIRTQAPTLSVVGGTSVSLPPHTDSSGANGVLVYVTNSAEEGIAVFPTHRILNGVSMSRLDEFVVGSGVFAAEDFADAPAALKGLEALTIPGFIAIGSGRVRLLSVPDVSDMELACPDTSDAWRTLDVTALHSLVIDGGATLIRDAHGVAYTHSAEEAAAAAINSDDRVAFLLRPIDVRKVHEIAAAGERLPHKSTYFFPKVPTGVAFRSLDPNV